MFSFFVIVFYFGTRYPLQLSSIVHNSTFKFILVLICSTYFYLLFFKSRVAITAAAEPGRLLQTSWRLLRSSYQTTLEAPSFVFLFENIPLQGSVWTLATTASTRCPRADAWVCVLLIDLLFPRVFFLEAGHGWATCHGTRIHIHLSTYEQQKLMMKSNSGWSNTTMFNCH